MATDRDAPLAQAIQRAVQPKLIENGWVADDADNELSEYITLMVINGKTQEQVVSEVGTELLGVGEDDPAVAELARWLYLQVPHLLAEVNGSAGAQETPQQQQAEQLMESDAAPQQTAQDEAPEAAMLQDEQMDEGTGVIDAAPSGPKAMRNGLAAPGGRGRDRRMLGQLNKQLDRSQDDPLSRIKGAAGGQSGRINSHAGRIPPKGPRGGPIANGINRAMNGRPSQQPAAAAAPPGALTPQQQMQFLQLMEQQATMMTQMFNGGMPNMQSSGPQRGRAGKSLFQRVDRGGRGGGRGGRGGNHHIATESNGDTTMDLDTPLSDTPARRSDPFDTLCRFNSTCTVATCPYAHQSPAAPPGTAIDLTDRCSYGAACENKKCAGKHPSPGQRKQHLKDDVDCKFYPNCANPVCPFRHPDMPACRNGADCTVPNCKFVHSKIMCRYNPCLNPGCVFKHAEGQKRGKFEDKVWKPSDGEGGEGFDTEAAMEVEAASKAGRFEGLVGTDGAGEELILPGRSTPERGIEEGVVT
nr:hypothetical protein B0A51_00651 [Rachicladosporium sp. CCFEE 5018]